MEKEMKTVTELIQKLREKHYIHDFDIVGDKIISRDTNENFKPEDLVIERIYRYEGDSNPDDMAVIYGMISRSGTQGILLDAYGTYANPKIAEIIKQVPVKEVDENQV